MSNGSRRFFINPYTFVPLAKSGPVIPAANNSPHNAHHLWFESDCFTGTIEVELQFIAPAVVPGKQEKGTEEHPGNIRWYRNNGKLAIPGSRLRGHLFHLMKAINSSPITHFRDRAILERAPDDPQRGHQKGYIIQENGQFYVVGISSEILMAAEDRSEQPKLSKGGSPKTQAELANGDKIPFFDPDNPSKGLTGELFFDNPCGRKGPQRFKRYLSDKGTPSTGTWVQFRSWSGQDESNELKDINGGTKVHKVAAHIVKIQDIMKTKYIIPEDTMEKFRKNVQEMAMLLEERGECPPDVYQRILKMADLEPGTFVYFETDDNGQVTSIGRHYRYLSRKGSIGEVVKRTNGSFKPDSCPLFHLAGYANDSETSDGLKSRLWVDMAFCQKEDPPLIESDLRILSSQPPKAANFYLNGNGYDDPNATIRGRKFYWHDPKWYQPNWDNQDLNTGQYAFENPLPNKNKKQWSRAEVLMAKTEEPVPFTFTIHAMNLSRDEFNLLITAIEGFAPAGAECDWTHKIGHARPFMGSARMQVRSVKKLEFDDNCQPILQCVDKEACFQLSEWQKQKCFLKQTHIRALRRIMRSGGAYEQAHQDARILYPVRHKEGGDPKWEKGKPENHPKTFQWFAKQKVDDILKSPPALPDPGQGNAQTLSVNWSPPSQKRDGSSSNYKNKGGHRR